MGRKLVVYMIDGKAYGPRSAEIGNWSGKAIFSPRASISKILARPEFGKPGIYCLKSNPESDLYEERVYIGEAEKIGDRLRQHLSGREFVEYIGFISKDELLTKSHIKFLESRMITMATEAKSAEIENSVAPSLPALPEADIADMEFFLDQIKLILPLMGFKFLIPSVISLDSIDTDNSIPLSREDEELYSIRTKNLQATMKEIDSSYVVMRGSEVRDTISRSFGQYLKKRKKLLEEGILTEEKGKLVFTKDTIFNSVSTAASLVLGRHANGNTEWINKQGQTYKEVQELQQ